MVYLLLGTGFEEIEAVTPLDLLRRAGISVAAAGIDGETVTGKHGISVKTDLALKDIRLEDAEMLVLPGGNITAIQHSEYGKQLLLSAWKQGKFVAAICAAPTVLASLGITDGKEATCFPGCEPQMAGAHLVSGQAAVRDGKLITGTSAGCAVPFALQLIEALRGAEAAKAVADQIVIR